MKMLMELGVVEHLSIQKFLCDRIQTSSLWVAQTGARPQDISVLADISLQRGREKTAIVYGCAIAFKLASLWQQPALKLAVEIATHLQGLLGNECRVEVVPPGTLRLQLCDVYLAHWLQQVIRDRASLMALAQVHRGEAASIPSLFTLQYPHARCCSLLRAAHRDQLIQLGDFEEQGRFFAIATPDPIPWLDHEQLRFTHATEWALLSQLISIMDRLESGDRPNSTQHWVALMTELAQVFLKFESACRIWGDVQRQQPKLAQARLGLILVTQKLMNCLLEGILAIAAPWEL